MSKDISLVIVHYKNEAFLLDQLSGLSSNDFEIVVVDNSNILSQSDLPNEVKLIDNPYNKGFSAACNQGISASTGKWILFLNPDVLISKNEIFDLVSYSKVHSLDALSPVSSDSNYNKPIPTSLSLLLEFTPFGKLVPKFLHLISNKVFNPFNKNTLTGGALLIKRDVIESLGGWDERFFLWFEDSDLTKRLYDKGHSFGFSPNPVNHLGGQSFSSMTSQIKKDIFFNGLDIFLRKHHLSLGNLFKKIVVKRFTKKKVIPALNFELVSVVIPNLRKSLLDSFLKINIGFFDLNKTELIIVTSALDSKSVWKYRKKYPLVRFITIKENQGFAQTVNIGLRASSGKYLGTINDDVILNKKYVSKLIADLPPKTGSINSKILDTKGKIETIGITILDKGKAIPNTDSTNIEKITSVDATNGASVIYSKEALSSVGLFDEKFGSYLEDIDLSLRIKRKGFLNLVKPKLEMVHLKHQTSSKINFNKALHDMKNWWLILIKNWSIKQWLINFPFILIERLRNISGVVKSDKKATVKGILILLLISLFVFLRLYKIETSLLFFNDIGRDFLELFRWEASGKPPLLGPQTSALPYNQSAVYFYLLYPLFILTGHSAFSTIFTVTIFYVLLFIFGLYYLRNNKLLSKSLILSFLLMTIHPQFIVQNRFVWNPSFIGPLLLLSFASFYKLTQKFSTRSLLIFTLPLALAVSLNYSIAPLFIAFMIVAPFYLYGKLRFITIWLMSTLSVLFWNLPTVAFELRHKFILTNLLFNGEKLEQKAITLSDKINDTLLFSLYNFNSKHYAIFLGLFIFSIVGSLIIQRRKSNHKTLLLAVLLLLITIIITFVVPISMQAHYIFAILTMAIIVISLLSPQFFIVILLILSFNYLKPPQLNNYFKPAYRSVKETISCADLICDNEPQPLFVSVQSGIHPYHNGMEFKYLFSDAGCNIKELDTQITEANHMAVVVDYSKYEHGKTAYNELTQFGDSSELRTYECNENLSVVIIEKN